MFKKHFSYNVHSVLVLGFFKPAFQKAQSALIGQLTLVCCDLSTAWSMCQKSNPPYHDRQVSVPEVSWGAVNTTVTMPLLLYHFKPKSDNRSKKEQVDQPEPPGCFAEVVFWYTSLTCQMWCYNCVFSLLHDKNCMSIHITHWSASNCTVQEEVFRKLWEHNKRLWLYCWGIVLKIHLNHWSLPFIHHWKFMYSCFACCMVYIRKNGITTDKPFQADVFCWRDSLPLQWTLCFVILTVDMCKQLDGTLKER